MESIKLGVIQKEKNRNQGRMMNYNAVTVEILSRGFCTVCNELLLRTNFC